MIGRISPFIYRLVAKWRYHTASDDFHRMVAEVNRLEPLVELHSGRFSIKKLSFEGDIESQGFVIQRFDLFWKLCSVPNTRFEVINDQLVYYIDGLQLTVTTAEELYIIHEIFVLNTYLIRVPERSCVMIDIGMNVGFASLFFAKQDCVTRVFGYEPFGPTFQHAIRNFNANPGVAHKIAPFNFGWGHSDEVLQVPYRSDKMGKNAARGMKGSATETIQIKNARSEIDSLLAKYPDDTFYIKMDCEGSEFEIFKAFQGYSLPLRIRGIVMEWHQRFPTSIVNYLCENRFRVQQRGSDSIGIVIAFR